MNNRKSSIAPAALQAVLDASSNAAQKGQAQWHTPPEWSKVLALPLPEFRPDICDLTCGNGKFLQSVRLNNSGHLLGCEIEPPPQSKDSSLKPKVNEPGVPALDVRPKTLDSRIHRTTADITSLFPLLKLVNFQCDLFVLNPPWDCHWYRDKLQQGFDLSIPAVISAFEAHDGRTARDTIDSTVATLCMALDLCSSYGEGLLIANEATLQRLLFEPGAPHRALTQHIWAHLVIEGNICQPIQSKDSSLKPKV